MRIISLAPTANGHTTGFLRGALLALVLLPALLNAQSSTPAALTGFAAPTLDAQARAEKVFLDTVTPERARRWLTALTEEPHVAGTPAEKKVVSSSGCALSLE